MPWWGWLIVGVGLLGAEMFLVDAQFYLVFLGVSATAVGLLALARPTMVEWMLWLVFAALSIFTMFAFRRRVYSLVRGRGGAVQERITPGDRVMVPVRQYARRAGQSLGHCFDDRDGHECGEEPEPRRLSRACFPKRIVW